MHLVAPILLIVLTLSGIYAACPTTPCQNGGFCFANVCQCPLCFVGSTYCETETTGAVDNPCPCLNGGTCKCYMYYIPPMTPATKHVCMCPPGYYGDRCGQTPFTVTTTPAPGPPKCTTGCGPAGTPYNIDYCTCLPYYYGPCCTIMFNGNPCSSYPCRNGGACSYSWAWANLIYVYKCTCIGSYTGTNCENSGTGGVDPCATNPCNNGGTCNKLSLTTYECICPCFHGGTKCEHAIAPLYFFNPCEAEPCQNGGTCYCAGHSYKCLCRIGYTGSKCESGTCVVGSCSYSLPCLGTACNCAPTHGGAFCQYPAGSPCLSDPCKNGGTCIHGTTGYTCKCPCWVTGINCDFPGLFLPLMNPCALPTSPCTSTQRCLCRGITHECI